MHKNNKYLKLRTKTAYLIIIVISIFLVLFLLKTTIFSNDFIPNGTLVNGSYKAHGEIRSTKQDGVNFDYDLNVISDKDYDIVHKNIENNTSQIYIIKNNTMYYSKDNLTWEKSTLSNINGVDDTGFKATRFTRTAEELDEMSSKFKYVNTVSCSTGVCEEWQYKDDTTDVHIYVSKDRKLTKYTYKNSEGLSGVVEFDFSTEPVVRSAPS